MQPQISIFSSFLLQSFHYSKLTVLFFNNMPIMIPILVCLFSVLLFLHWHHRIEYRPRRLPPGSMGWPYIGETLKLYTENPNSFFSNRQKRYGDIFKTHILGCPCVMVASPEAIRKILVTQANLFKPTYPISKEKMIGPQAVFFQHGESHIKLKKLVQASFLPSSIRGSVEEIEQIVLNLLLSWKNETVNTLLEMKKYAFSVAMISVFGDEKGIEKEEIKGLYHCLENGYNSMPLNIPGTRFHKAMKARKELNEKLTRLIEKRRKSEEHEGGLLGGFLGASSSRDCSDKASDQKLLSESQIADNITGVIFAAHDTTATVLTWILKYLQQNQLLLESVTREQEEIKNKIIEENRGLTWEDTKHMPLTNRVIQETLRTASILSFTFREAIENVEIDGYLIPKGWKVLPLFRNIHHSAEFFPHPHRFDPSRFEVAPKPNTYMPFGKGLHACPGNELAKLEMLILLHHLTTTYRWQALEAGDEIQYGPFPVPKSGLPIRVVPRSSKCT